MLAACTGDTGLVGLTRMLGGVGLGRGVLWVGAGEGRTVGDVQVAGKKRGGSGGAASSSPPSSRAWVGAEGAGVDREGAREHGDSAGASQHSAAPVILISPRFASASARRNARKNSKFKFSKFSTLGAHHIS
jgi:hypothetical protein